jgi:hypothetical protein
MYHYNEYYYEDYEILLYIYQGNSYIALDNCSRKNNKEFICSISKEKLEENLVLLEDSKFGLSILLHNSGSVNQDNVLDIKINYLPEKNRKYIYRHNLLIK